jgi:hypothetical protein
MHRIAEQHGLIIPNAIQQALVLLDKGSLLVRVQLA